MHGVKWYWEQQTLNGPRGLTVEHRADEGLGVLVHSLLGSSTVVDTVEGEDLLLAPVVNCQLQACVRISHVVEGSRTGH